MASSLQQHSLLLTSLLLILFSLNSTAQTSFRPKALVLKVTKDASTRQYLTTIAQGTPLSPAKLALDLGGEFLWFDCHAPGLNSSTRRHVPCRSAACNLAGGQACSGDNVCVEFPHNPFNATGTSGDFSRDILSVQSTDGRNPSAIVSVPNFLFTCAPSFLLQNLASGVVGVAGLGRSRVSLPSLFSAAFSFPRKFAVCLSSSADKNGVVVFGDGPYVLLPGIDVSKTLTYTPLIRNPVSLIGGFEGEPSTEYFIGVKSVNIDGKPVPVNASLLSFDSEGHGGTKISTAEPYTSLESSIYTAVVNAFVAALAAKNVARVPADGPFGACFAAKDIGASRTGPIVPPIDLVLGNGVTWRISGANSMVRVSSDVLCLGFVDGGPLHFVDWGVKFTSTAIVIGGHQIEDNLLQFDLASSRLGFSSSLLSRQTSCFNFNFTSIA